MKIDNKATKPCLMGGSTGEALHIGTCD